MQTTNKS